MTSALEKISIADAIADLRDQIAEARIRGGVSKGVKFGVKELEIELNVFAEQTDSAGGKASISWFLFGGEASYGAEFAAAQTHTIRMKLDARDEKTGEPIALSR